MWKRIVEQIWMVAFNRTKPVVLFLILGVLFACNMTWAVSVPMGGSGNARNTDGRDNFMPEWMKDRIEIGARVHYFSLKDTRRTIRGRYENTNVRGNFVGSVWGLDEIQDYVPRLFANVMMNSYFGVGMTYDMIAAETVDWGDLEKSFRTTDGDLKTWAPILYLLVKWPNETRFEPFAELGSARYFARFKEDPVWAATAPGYRFEVDDSWGTTFALGCNLALSEHWHAHLYWRRMRGASANARAYFSPSSRVGRFGEFPLEYDMYGIGTSYRF